MHIVLINGLHKKLNKNYFFVKYPLQYRNPYDNIYIKCQKNIGEGQLKAVGYRGDLA